MRRLAVLASVMVFAAGAVAYSPSAEAHRRGYGGIGAGIVAAAVIGGILAASYSSRRRHYAYYPQYRSHYYGPSYAYAAPTYVYRRPVYAYRPVYVHRPARVYRHVRHVRAGFHSPRRVAYRVRRW